jgi:hypothetical protein
MPDGLPGRRRVVRRRGPARRAADAISAVLHDLRVSMAVLALTVTVLLSARLSAEMPQLVQDLAVLTSTTALAVWLTVRAGGSAYLGGALAIGLGGAAVLTREPVLLVGAAVGTAAVAAMLGLLATAPAPRFRDVVREYLLAIGIAVVGGLTAAGYDAPVSTLRAYYLVVGLSLLGTLALVYKLGAGLHGLGRRGAVMIVSGTVLLFLVLAYTYALSHWGSEDLRTALRDVDAGVSDAIGAVPRPGQFLLGFPALAWGVSQRARRRQGWWFGAFGTVGLASVAISVLGGTTLGEGLLGVLYAALIGLLLGYAVLCADAYLTGTRGRRARLAEAAAAHRPEPPRLTPLM